MAVKDGFFRCVLKSRQLRAIFLLIVVLAVKIALNPKFQYMGGIKWPSAIAAAAYMVVWCWWAYTMIRCLYDIRYDMPDDFNDRPPSPVGTLIREEL